MYSPESTDTALIFPVVFFKIDLINTDLGTYSRTSTILNALDFMNIDFSIVNISLFKLDIWVSKAYALLQMQSQLIRRQEEA